MNSRERDEGLSLDEWYNRYYTPLVLWADTIIHDIAKAEDIVQELFVYLCEKDRYQSLDKIAFKSYLYISVRNTALRSLHACRNIQTLPDISIVEKVWDEEEEDTYEDLIKQMNEEVERLSPRSREVLECVYLKNMKYAEVATHLNISIATVKTLLVRSLKNLRTRLNKSILLFFYHLVRVK
ncbi:MAG: sigma-70 family RNA polymerase sigma factor [Odoribacteraceae bacterium]|jgi:RNA polymerase sigma-70 factor (ECF subfamily)|nr:sigma-70 family RNA polymerase sigma factor [Odoribacteraceae bacterium]